MEKEKCKNITTIKKITSGVTAMVAMAAGIVMMPFIANASSENIQNSFGGGYKDTVDEYVIDTNEDDGKISEQADDTGQVYDFKDNKTTGTVTVTKVWDDGLTNDEREIPDIKISTKKPSKSTLGYTVTFHGNGMKFADGSEENMVVYNSAGEIVQGEYKLAIGNNVTWCRKPDGGGAVEISNDGILSVPTNEDIDLWAKEMTFEIKGYKGSPTYENGFNQSIPSTVTEVIFTDEIKPVSAEVIDVDADGDGGVVAWTENNGTIMRVSTQIKGIKVQAAVNSSSMFYEESKIKKIDFKMLDTSNVTNMKYMFFFCIGLTSLDLTPLNTSNVTSMEFMFSACRNLTSLDLTPLDTSKVTDMTNMFKGCSDLISLDLTPLDTLNVTSMNGMFCECSGLRSLDLTPLDTSKVANMGAMFSGCDGLTSLDLTGLDTSNVTYMGYMFYNCSGLTALDLSTFDTQNVTSMSYMFYDCDGLTSITTGPNFKFVGTGYKLYGTWQNTAGETFNGNDGTANFPSNVADTYTKIS